MTLGVLLFISFIVLIFGNESLYLNSTDILYNNNIGNITLSSKYSLSFNIKLNNYNNNNYDNNPLLIVKHVNSSLGYFNPNIKNTYLENENNSNSNTYMIIGKLNKYDYLRQNLYYKFKIKWYLVNGSTPEIIWTQQVWLTDTVTNIEQMGGTMYNYVDTNALGHRFYGLALSARAATLLDGDGKAHPYWWNSVGSIGPYNTDKIPAVNRKVAWGVELYVYPGYGEDSQNNVRIIY